MIPTEPGANRHSSFLWEDARGKADALRATEAFSFLGTSFPTHTVCSYKRWNTCRKFTYLCSVWVGFLWVNSPVILHILESLVHETTIATLIAFWAGAVHQILFTQWNKLASFSEVLSFESSCSAESPARATLTLKQEVKSQVTTNLDRLSNYSSHATNLNLKKAKARSPTFVPSSPSVQETTLHFSS